MKLLTHPTEFQAKMLAACDETLKDRLKAPATYHRVDAYAMPVKTATEDEFFGWDNPSVAARDKQIMRDDKDVADTHEFMVRAFKSQSYKYVELDARYDAENSFGVPLRSHYDCTLVTATPDKFEDIDTTKVKVNGYDQFEWAMTQLARANGLKD